jgi:hypothetical protein
MAQRGPSDVIVSVDDPRPLAKAADVLELKFGIGISYEDPAWSYRGDVARLVDTPYGKEIAQQNPQMKAVIPKGGSLELKFSIDPLSRRPTAGYANVLADLLSEHTRRGNPGEFRVVAYGTDFAVVPTSARDQKGTLTANRSPLDAAIWFAEAERDGLTTIKTICDAVSAASGKKVVLGTLSLNLFNNTTMRVGANGEIARDVLGKVFRDLHWSDPRNIAAFPKLSWRLLYGPDTEYYALNIKGVQQEVPAPAGGTKLIPVTRAR